LVRVYARPYPFSTRAGKTYLCFGGFNAGLACFDPSDMVPGAEVKVLETRGVSGLFPTAPSFSAWIVDRCARARRRFTKTEWAAIIAGPAPFSQEEQAVVSARSLFEWRFVRLTPNALLQFEVTNNSALILASLTIGLRSSSFVARIRLPVSHVEPGCTRLSEIEIPYVLEEPETLAAFAVPQPWPEDRKEYFEFENAS